ncbi:MAG: hypothetical protein PVI00_14095 [Desulfobacterales bacterium]|jgi:hypothetical protein
MSKMPRYEVRYDANEGWIEISDLEFMDELYKLYRRVTPVIKEMINGRELRIQEAVYRLKWQGKNRPITEMEPNHASTVLG